MKYKTYEEHLKKWNHARELVKKHNDKLIWEWDSIPWWKFWIKKLSFEEKREIILDNWSRFNRLPIPHLMDYF
jgi:16S rRNA G527 N7-methylase RsmG